MAMAQQQAQLFPQYTSPAPPGTPAIFGGYGPPYGCGAGHMDEGAQLPTPLSQQSYSLSFTQ